MWLMFAEEPSWRPLVVSRAGRGSIAVINEVRCSLRNRTETTGGPSDTAWLQWCGRSPQGENNDYQ